jgi:uncharacterized membrane-anchored protein
VPVALAKVIMHGLALYLIRVGATEERVRPFAGGVLYFLVWAFARYIDLFAQAGGMLGAAALFALTAAALVVVAVFWGRTRAAHREPGLVLPSGQPVVGPAWVEAVAQWFREHTRPVLIVAAAAQIGLLLGMIAVHAAPLVLGETVVLRVRPVDPRDFFRGDYVTLAYDINGVPPAGIEGDPLQWQGGRLNRVDYPVYVTLEPEADGVHWRPARASVHRPASGKYIRGRFLNGQLRFGIEAFYVQEGRGLEWERLRNSRQLSAEIALTSWGQAALRQLRADD